MRPRLTAAVWFEDSASSVCPPILSADERHALPDGPPGPVPEFSLPRRPPLFKWGRSSNRLHGQAEQSRSPGYGAGFRLRLWKLRRTSRNPKRMKAGNSRRPLHFPAVASRACRILFRNKTGPRAGRRPEEHPAKSSSVRGQQTRSSRRRAVARPSPLSLPVRVPAAAWD